MKNIPVFTAAGGTATLILRELPKSGRAYIILQTYSPGMKEAQARECAAFCRMAGAAEVYVSCADGTALALPHSHDMLQLSLPRDRLAAPQREICLTPLGTQTQALYIELFNQRFLPVLNAAMCDLRSLNRAASEGSRQFLAYHHDLLIGLGSVCQNALEAVAAVQPGWGQDLTCALLAQAEGDPIVLTVCSANAKAMQLYAALGFEQTALVSRWWKL